MMEKEYKKIMEEMKDDKTQYEDIWQDGEYQMYEQYKNNPEKYVF